MKTSQKLKYLIQAITAFPLVLHAAPSDMQIFREIEQEIDAPSFVHEEGVDLGPLSPEGIEKFVEFATNAKRESEILLEDLVQTRKRSEKVRVLINGMRGIVTRNYPRESGLQLRIAHNRGVALVERVIRPSSLGMDLSGTLQIELAVLTESVRLAIAEYEPDLKYRDALKSFHEGKGAEPSHDRARFGLNYAQKLWALKERHMLGPIQDYALSLAVMELLQWDLAKDKMNESYSTSIVELYCQIPKKVQSKFCAQKLNPYPEQVTERQARSLLSQLEVSMKRALREAGIFEPFIPGRVATITSGHYLWLDPPAWIYVGEGTTVEILEPEVQNVYSDKHLPGIKVKVIQNHIPKDDIMFGRDLGAEKGRVGWALAEHVKQTEESVSRPEAEVTRMIEKPISGKVRKYSLLKATDNGFLENARFLGRDETCPGPIEFRNLSGRYLTEGTTVQVLRTKIRKINNVRMIKVRVERRPSGDGLFDGAPAGCEGWFPINSLVEEQEF